ncbi:D-alanyl-D-alanine carboxypeptidase family protein [Anaerosporobacter sp.]
MKRILTSVLTAVLLLSNIGDTTAYAATTQIEQIQTSTVKSTTDTSTETKSTFKWPKYKGSLTSESAVLIDASSGLVLYEKNPHKELYPASITKIMTTLVALENCSLNEIVTFSHNAVFSIESGSTHIARQEGEQLTMEQCLYAVMLASANEVSNAVAEHVAGSIDKFADMMNAKAKELGCKNTHFVNANGLHNENHYTSAYDMALISQEALKNEAFRKITGTKSYVLPKTNKSDQEFPMANHQQLLLGYKLTKKYDACIGGKTGYTNAARNTLVSFASQDGVDLICVVMKSTPTEQYSDTIKLFDFGFDNYESFSVDETSSLSANDNSILFTRFNSIFDNSTPLIYTDNDSSYILPLGASEKDVTQSMNLYDTPKIQNGREIIGDINYTFDNKNVGKLDIYYTTSDKPTLESVELSEDHSDDSVISTLSSAVSSKIKHNIKPLIIIGIIAILIILYAIYYIVIELPRKRRRNSYYHRKNSRNYDDFNL